MSVSPGPAAPPITGVHHTAFRCKDAAETRRFYEDVLGLRLAAALAFDKEPGTNAPLQFMHLFFEMGDGRYVAFFDVPESADESRFRRKNGFNLHIAFEVAGLDELGAMKERLAGHGIECHGPIDHGFVRSIYTWDPNGIQVEITARTAQHAEFMESERVASPAALAEWEARSRALRPGRSGA